MSAFAALLAPLTPQTFLAEWHDRATLHLPAEAWRARLFDGVALDAMLSRAAIAPANLFAIDARRTLAPADYCRADGSADVLALLDLFEAGATLVLREADRFHAGLWRLCRSCERWLGAPAFANVYYAPPGGQSFPVHYDALDVFAIQIEGTKRWSLFHPHGPRPLRHEHCYGEINPPPAPDRDIALAPGELLYVPRGVPHLVAAGDAPSLHVSVSLTPLSLHDVMRAELDRLAAQDGAHRALARDDLGLPWPAATADGMARARDALLFAQTPVAVERPLAARRLAARLDDASLLARDPDLPVRLEDAGDHWRVLGNGRAIGFAREAGEAVRMALAGAAFAVGALPGLADAAARRDLAATLVRQGLVREAPTE